MLDNLGLLPALIWQFDRYTAQTGVVVRFEPAGLDRRFPPAVETAGYRLTQEALTNGARHARVGEVTVRLRATETALTLLVEDGGAGFDAGAALSGQATGGLTGMHERARLLGGQVTVESTPGAGTQVDARFPLGQPVEGDAGARW